MPETLSQSDVNQVLNFITQTVHKHPLLAHLRDKMLKTHTRSKFPFHCCTNDTDERGIPTDHLNRTTFFTVLFAHKEKTPNHQIELLALSAVGHDYFQGPDHEQRSASKLANLMQKRGQYSAKEIDLVTQAICSTQVIMSKGKLIQQKPLIHLAKYLQSADLEVSGGAPWPEFIEYSMRVRWENALKQGLLSKGESEPVPFSFWQKEMYFLHDLFANHTYRTKVARRYFPYLEKNVNRLSKKLIQLPDVSTQEKTLVQWAGWLL